MDNILIALLWFSFGYIGIQVLFIISILLIDIYENKKRQKIYDNYLKRMYRE